METAKQSFRALLLTLSNAKAMLAALSIVAWNGAASAQPPPEEWVNHIGTDVFGVQAVTAVGYVNGELWAAVRWQHEPVPQYDEFDLVNMRYNFAGEFLGEVNYGPHADDEDEWAYAIATDGTHNVIGGMCRYCPPTNEFSPNYFLLKVDGAGNELWRARADQGVFRGMDSDEDIIRGIMIRPDGRIWVVGESFTDGRRLFLACFDANGQFNATFSRVFTTYWASAYGIIPTPDNGALIYGIRHADSDTYPLILKVDQTGNEQWTRFYERGGGIDGYCVGAVRVNDGYVLSIMYNGFGGALWLKKVDLQGNTVWDQDHPDIHPYAMSAAPDGGFAVAGIDEGRLSLRRFNSNAEVLWTGLYGSGVSGSWMNMVRLPDGSYVLGGQDGQSNGIIVKTGAEVLRSDDRPTGIPQNIQVHDPYPNPFNSSTTIRYELTRPAHVTVAVFNLNGSEVAKLEEERMGPGSHLLAWSGRDREGNNVASGLYFISVRTELSHEQKKVLLLR